jgi:phospholipase C
MALHRHRQALAAAAFAVAAQPALAEGIVTATPIKHLVVVIGENRSFDHVFATYVPRPGQRVANLLAKGIVRADGSPGPNFAAAAQVAAAPQPRYFIGLGRSLKTPYRFLPAPTLGGAPPALRRSRPPFADLSPAELAAIEPALEPHDLALLTTGATGAGTLHGRDPRIARGDALPNGPFPLTRPALSYDSYTGDTTHRFYQMWQQSDCRLGQASAADPSGCLADLYPYVVTTYAGGHDRGGGTAMAFYNMARGDAPLLKRLADRYTISDNYHQPAMGGTGLQHIFLGSGDDVFWSDGNGRAAAPPAAAIADPDPLPGSDNRYTRDGRYSDCSDPRAPGAAAILAYLRALPYRPASRCAPGHFYLLNNAAPGFLPDGEVDRGRIARGFAVPPSRLRTIGDALSANGIGWAYYGGGYRAALRLAAGSTDPRDRVGRAYCRICNFAEYSSAIMADPGQRRQHLGDVVDFFAALRRGVLPSVAFVKPDEMVDGHPATSKLDLFEAMLRKILAVLRRHPRLRAETALLITFDEAGGYYDSGYIEPIDFFGDGPRVPLIAVSPYSHGGRVVHTYADHVSILKFIERNWHLAPLSARSRDNLPDPLARRDNPYVPTNSPAIGDLFDLFRFGHGRS